MRTSIHMISIQNSELHFFFDEDNRPAIDAHGKVFSSLFDLLKEVPDLAFPRYLDKIAQIINFFNKGLEFQYIDNIENFKEDYLLRIEAEQLQWDGRQPRLSDFGIFNVETIHPPLIIKDKLVFFVKNDYTSIPYRVSIQFPFIDESILAHYELLPHL